MALASFELIVTTDNQQGISRLGKIPWAVPSVRSWFSQLTMGRGHNAVIMGRKTYEALPNSTLSHRECIVLSRTLNPERYPDRVFPSLNECLAYLATASFHTIFILGGQSVFECVVKKYLYLCKKIHHVQIKADYECDQIFPLSAVSHFPLFQLPMVTREWTCRIYTPNITHGEYQYLNALKKIMTEGELKPNRTGISTWSVFGLQLQFDLREGYPLLTTKKMAYKSIWKELLFFISGQTDTKILEEQGVGIWKGNTSRAFLDGRNLTHLKEGDMGKMYGYQWRHWNGCDASDAKDSEASQGVDQLSQLIEQIKTDPHSRRHVLSTWNVSQLEEMALPPCHVLFQLNVSSDRQYLDGMLTMRSNDFFLGAPFNIASYALLMIMIGHLTKLKPRYYIHSVGDAHVYTTHKDAVEEQLKRTPYPFPEWAIQSDKPIRTIDDFKLEHFLLKNYTSHAMIRADMAI